MKPNEVFEVNATRKKLEGAAAIFIGVFILGVIISYFVFLRKLDLFEGTVIASIVSSVKSQITAFSLIGSWYVAFFGGLFFIFVPLEIYFITAIKNDPWIVYLVFLFGISISYSLDYLIGVKLSKVSRKLISPKKFYTVKSYLNTHGKLGIFLASAIPFFPSQQITFILGVFRYNWQRLAVLTLLGQAVKFGSLLAFFSLF